MCGLDINHRDSIIADGHMTYPTSDCALCRFVTWLMNIVLVIVVGVIEGSSSQLLLLSPMTQPREEETTGFK